MIQCPNCRFPNAAGRKFCGNCGSMLPVTCPNCGHYVTPGYQFCGNCGSPIMGFAPPGGWGQMPAQPSQIEVLLQKIVFLVKTSRAIQFSLLFIIIICLGIFIFFQLIYHPDKTPPQISNIQVTHTGKNTATITWQTNELASSQVEYGRNIKYGSFEPAQPMYDPTTGTTIGVYNHKVYLYRLVSDSTYHYRVRSKDAAGNEAISQQPLSFKTKAHEPFATGI